MKRYFLVICLMAGFWQGCVTAQEQRQQELDKQFDADLPKVRTWHVECHEKNVVESCLRGARFGMKFGFESESMKDLIKACSLGDEFGCIERDRLKARILMQDAYAEQDFRDSRKRQYEDNRAFQDVLIKGMNPQSSQKTSCVQKYNTFMRQYETVCETK